jgi:integrase
MQLETAAKHLILLFGSTRIDNISRQQIQQWVAGRKGRSYSPTSIDRYHAVLSTVLTKAVEWGYLPNNPASGVQLSKLVTVREKWVLTPKQASALLTHLPPTPGEWWLWLS